ncbi:MAG: ribulose-phosphate 3-epimerase [Thermoplasmata archaeon]|nr:MAG: ribulose-phosphate 3-epimerase [Thermoplasmata archaeon]HDD60198.1 ribulose-phosphate 3-epimerase [Euryarchaeota archaeon]RLF69083.1 MAG: ribulose-phosphate 3-epimerase [Thermoplasmata archaeon]RLF72412.1 MAG: ribulose-phosphate 3-epimerase [Thermoplasmata archaeon]RLF74224.1 MAG: ribulose-phosphate 3-epimerase [Thermoplasmata archaeon]
MVLISASILSADFAHLEEDVKRAENAGADMIHIDVMDGRFVPNITIGPPVVRSIRDVTELPFDVHLMIVEPERYLEDFANAGADLLTVHQEVSPHLDRTLHAIEELGIKPGVALNPHTPVQTIKHVLHLVEIVLIMTVNPGFGGQRFLPYVLDKVAELKSLIEEEGLEEQVKISVDGGVNPSNIRDVVEAGAHIAVAGSAVFSGGEIEENLRRLIEAQNL